MFWVFSPFPLTVTSNLRCAVIQMGYAHAFDLGGDARLNGAELLVTPFHPDGEDTDVQDDADLQKTPKLGLQKNDWLM